MTWPCLDHGILSPSGRISKRAREAALERARKKLFGDGKKIEPPAPDYSREAWLHRAKEFRALAARGMKPRRHIKEAERCERLAAEAPLRLARLMT